MSVPKLSYTLDEAATATGLSKRHLQSEIRLGRLRTKTTKLDADEKPVGRRLILASALESYLEGLADA